MGRKNNTNRRHQSLKHRIEDKMTMRAVDKMLFEQDRNDQQMVTIDPDGSRYIRFNDPSYYV